MHINTLALTGRLLRAVNAGRTSGGQAITTAVLVIHDDTPVNLLAFDSAALALATVKEGQTIIAVGSITRSKQSRELLLKVYAVGVVPIIAESCDPPNLGGVA